MAKISRPIVYTVVAGVAVYAVFLYTQPATVAKRAVPRTGTASRNAAANNPSGILPEDLKASFPAYAGPRHDAFQPRVVVARAVPSPPPAAGVGPAGVRGIWSLTGISAIDGQQTALLENSATGESIFVKTGDLWMGERVARIGEDSVTFINPLGQSSVLNFPTPPDPDAPKGVGGVPAPGASPAPAGATPAAVPPVSTTRAAGLSTTPPPAFRNPNGQ